MTEEHTFEILPESIPEEIPLQPLDTSAEEIAETVPREATLFETVQDIPVSEETVYSLPMETAGSPASGAFTPYYQRDEAVKVRTRTDMNGDPVGDRVGFWPRISAALIDLLVSAVIWLILILIASFFTDRLEEPFFFSVRLITVLLYLAVKAYYIFSEWKFQQTLGKRALRIGLISSETFGKADLWTVFFRETFGKFVSGASIIGDLMLLGKEHLPLYDRLSDTEVVYTVNRSRTQSADGTEKADTQENITGENGSNTTI